jgi:hypothetical protein
MKFYLLFNLLFQSKFIKNSEYPICKKCIYYQEDINFPNDYQLAKCLLFGTQNIITGEIINNYVDIIRKDDKLCSIKGKYYKEHILS